MISTTTPTKGRIVLSLCLLLFSFFAYSNSEYWELVCPPDVTVDCDAEIWDLSIYGDAYIHTYGGNQSAGSPSVHYYLNSCNSGYITRTWMVEDPYWNWVSCTQTIYVGGGGSFGYHNIQWPDDTEVEGCHPDVNPDITGKPTWDYVECSMIGVSYRDKVFTFADGCKKVMRQWTLLNWCKNSQGQFPTYTHNQFIKIVNKEVPEFDCPEDIIVSSKNCKNAYVDVDPLVLDPSICGGNFTIFNDSPYALSKGADLSGTYPVGTTKVALGVRFACGMFKTCWVNVIVKNDQPPTPICLGQLNVALMGMDTDNDGINDQGMVDIWAKDLDHKSYSPCGFEPLQFSFAEDSIQMWRRFTCDEVGLNNVKMYVSDAHGNQSYCLVKVDIQNNSANITPCIRTVVDEPDTTTSIIDRFSLLGQVRYNDGSPVEGIKLELKNTDDNIQIVTSYDTTIVTKIDSFINYSGAKLYFYTKDTLITSSEDSIIVASETFEVQTNEDGDYTFDSLLLKDESYQIKCTEMDASLTNINTKDLDLLTNFILGNTTFDNAYQYLAADLNSDGNIDLEDLSLMIDFIQGEINTFGNDDWKVYLNNPDFESNPELILQDHTNWTVFNDVTDDVLDVEFIATQKGDLIEGTNRTSVRLDYRSAEEYLAQFSNQKIRAYPNPFDDLINLEIQSEEETTAIIRIFDIAGQTILSGKKYITKGTNTIQASIDQNIESIVFYQVIIGNKTSSGKLIRIKN